MKTITLEWITYDLVIQENQLATNAVSYKRPRANKCEEYFYIDSDIIEDCIENSDEEDNWHYNTWNYYLTEQQAQKALDKQLATVRVNDAIDELNEGWVGDWSDENDYKYSIIYDRKEHKFLASASYSLEFLWSIKDIKSEKIYQQIIKEHEEDLKLIFNIV